MSIRELRTAVRRLYEGATPAGVAFRYALLAFDLATVAFIVVTSFLPPSRLVETTDHLIGIVVLAEFLVRLASRRRPLREFGRLATWIDIVVILSFLAPLTADGAAFLRVLRTVRLLRAYQTLRRLRTDSAWFRRHEDAVLAAVNLAVFIFIATAVVYETQKGRNPQIGDYADALYFTVATLTTTGFGDVTMQGTSGRMISVAMMISGVTLFFNLARALFSPSKVRFRCPACGLMRHDRDAVHCKSCGALLDIPDDGSD